MYTYKLILISTKCANEVERSTSRTLNANLVEPTATKFSHS